MYRIISNKFISVKSLKEANVSHNDIKPTNFLVDWPQNESPSVHNLKVYLSDFGMVDKCGGYTPLYGAPGKN